jgi:hypothetical protein
MKRINPETKTGKLFAAFTSGQKLTAAQAAKRFGIKNLSAEASRIRAHGYAIYADNRKAGNGVQDTEYVLGKPSRRVVAAGYKAFAMGLA